MSARTELLSYVPTWEGKPKAEVVEGMLSFSMETNRIPDYYSHDVDNFGKFLDPLTGELIENSVKKDTFLYEKEYEGLQKEQEWARNNDSGFIVWISPPSKDNYLFTKIIVSEMVKTTTPDSKTVEKKITHRAIIIDTDSKGSIELANEFINYSNFNGLFDNTETIRSQPIPLEKLTKDEWLIITTHILKDYKVWKMIDGGEDIKLKEKARPVAEKLYAEMFIYPNRMGQIPEELFSIFGTLGGSCSSGNMLGAFNALFPSLLNTVESSFPCPKCKGAIPSGVGITTCPHCGITKEEVGSTCD